MSGLAGFLLARLAEDEERAHLAAQGLARGQGVDGEIGSLHVVLGGEHVPVFDLARTLAEIAAKRAVVELDDLYHYGDGDWFVGFSHGVQELNERVVKLLVQPYAEHPDFDPRWRAG